MREKMTEETAAYRLFDLGYDCCQTVLSYCAEDLGMDEEDALKLGSGFGGGLHVGEVCGCVTGAVMALGLKYGFSEPKDDIGKQIMNARTGEFIRRFKEENGALRCKELLGYDVSIPEEKAKIGEDGIIPQKCPGLVCSACRILDNMLDD
ncbi:MAG: C_GCAxxG_C_C family protein [Clostridiales bacterium]|jgi:C_GCAxxG_C_C family probable redox protein|nr:C_GCAxxG_C_C family protein [Clostridiales bacterium]